MQQLWAQKGRKKLLTIGRAQAGSDLQSDTLTCTANLSVMSGRGLHVPELPWVGPAIPPGAQSLLQAVTEHRCYSPAELLLVPSLCFRH